MATILAVVASTTAASRATADELRWKFKKGEALHYEMVQKTVTEIKANGQEIKTTLGQTINSTWKVDSVAEDGTADLAQSLDRVRTKIESAFGAFEFDSDVEKVPEGPIAAGVVPLLKTLVGATFRYKMSPRGELSDIRVPEGLVQKLKEAGPTAANVGMFSEEGLKNMILESSLNFPAEPLEIGKSWSRQSKIPSPPIGTLVMNKTYRYEGPSQKGERIGLEVLIELESMPNNPIDVKLGDQNGKGFFIFDNQSGRVVESGVGEKVQMVIKVMDQELSQITDTSTAMKLLDVKAAEPK
ncbi:MAG: DUF6263 family protein [Isosphaeraceae bacterium]